VRSDKTDKVRIKYRGRGEDDHEFNNLRQIDSMIVDDKENRRAR
jgi:hypothetical protein